ncbi:MAG: hypothetical protein K2J08_03480 [Ruminococcus sp.]|nr:hypothetical protein [Ruminococcus sp.]
MNKFKQCLYTVLLLVTCLVASPLIFRQIWKSSRDVEPASAKKPPVIDLKKNDNEEETTTEMPETEILTETVTEIATEEVTTEPPPPDFVESDPSYFDDALFIGDSRTVGIRDYGTLPNASYFCSVGLATYKLEYEYDESGITVYDKLNSNQYGKVYIMLGINELGNDFQYTSELYRNFIEYVKQSQPNAIIYILANLHVSQYRETEGDLVNNTAINAVNESTAQLADGKTVFYLDVNQIFDDASTGSLMAECTSDGVHVLAKYYETWCQWLCMNTIPVFNPDSEITTDEIIPETSDIPVGDTQNYDYIPEGELNY